jgi:Xaa-Pro dipeptidase
MKLHEMQKIMQNKEIEACVFFNNAARPNPTYNYFSQHNADGAIIIPAKGKEIIIASRLDKESGNAVVWDKGRLIDFVKKQLAGAKKIGIDKNYVSANGIKDIRKKIGHITDVSKIVQRLRQTKTEKEIENIKKSAKISESIIEECIANFSRFKTELDVSKFLKIQTIEMDSLPGFEPVVGAGLNSSVPHHKPDTTKISRGVCIIDFGVSHNGYCADITRTLIMGKPKDDEIQRLGQNIAAEAKIIDAIKPGINGSWLHNYANEVLQTKMIHGIGHGVGIEVHETPYLGTETKDKIMKGMIIAIEPAVYNPKRFGIRTEDMVLVLEKPRLLTKPQGIIRV